MHPLQILRKRDCEARSGLSRTQLERLEAAELWPPRLPISARAVGWPAHEIDAVLAARIAGRSDDQIRAIVRRLVAARARAFDQFEAA